MDKFWCIASFSIAICLLSLFFVFKLRQAKQDRTLAENSANEKLLEALLSLQSAHEDLKKLEKLRDKYKDMYLLHFDKNQSFEKQRTVIWELYRLSGLQAGNAQALLLAELQHSVVLLNRYREAAGEPPIQVRNDLKRLVDEFSQEHGARRPEELVLNG